MTPALWGTPAASWSSTAPRPCHPSLLPGAALLKARPPQPFDRHCWASSTRVACAGAGSSWEPKAKSNIQQTMRHLHLAVLHSYVPQLHVCRQLLLGSSQGLGSGLAFLKLLVSMLQPGVWSLSQGLQCFKGTESSKQPPKGGSMGFCFVPTLEWWHCGWWHCDPPQCHPWSCAQCVHAIHSRH